MDTERPARVGKHRIPQFTCKADVSALLGTANFPLTSQEVVTEEVIQRISFRDLSNCVGMSSSMAITDCNLIRYVLQFSVWLS
jgi:hypothetical protein